MSFFKSIRHLSTCILGVVLCFGFVCGCVQAVLKLDVHSHRTLAAWFGLTRFPAGDRWKTNLKRK